jgi:hypothetical protein
LRPSGPTKKTHRLDKQKKLLHNLVSLLLTQQAFTGTMGQAAGQKYRIPDAGGA